MNLLALDTSSSACSLAIQLNHDHGAPTILKRHEIAPRQHAKTLLAMMKDLLLEADIDLSQIDCLVFGKGPGSFTGIRLAGSVMQALSVSQNIPIIPVSSLAAMAQAAYLKNSENRILVALDARQNAVYVGAYELESGRMKAVMRDERVALSQLREKAAWQQGDWIGVGDAWAAYNVDVNTGYQHPPKMIDETVLPTAEALLVLASDALISQVKIEAKDIQLNYLY